MSTKYGMSPREKWRLQSQDRPRFTDHSVDRHDQRTPSWAASPETAYREGVPLGDVLGLFEDQGGQKPDRARFYAEAKSPTEWYGVVLLIRNRHVITVYSWRGLAAPVKAYLEVVALTEGLV